MLQFIIIPKGKPKGKLLIAITIAIAILIIIIPFLISYIPRQVINIIADRGRLVPIYYVDTNEKKAALSFDASWGATRTNSILETLKENNIKTTFFLTGYWISDYPHLVRQIHDEGHEIGNHTYTHPHLNSLTEEQICKELDNVHEMIYKETGQEIFLFRPPFGEYNNKVIQAAEKKGYIPIQWSVDSLDWQDIAKDAIIQRISSQIHPGAIILMHNNGKYTADALPEIIDHLHKEGYKIVPISELIYRNNYYIDSTDGAQKKKTP